MTFAKKCPFGNSWCRSKFSDMEGTETTRAPGVGRMGVRWRPLCVYTFRSDAGPVAGVGRSEQAELIAVNTKAAGFGDEGEESMSGDSRFTGWDHLLNRDTRGGVDWCRGSEVRSSFCVRF